METPRPRRALAITSLVLAILAALAAIVPVLGMVLGIAAIIFGAIALKRRQPKGFSLTGIILGSLATLTSAVVTATVILAGSLFVAGLNSLESDGVTIILDDPDTFDGEDDETTETETTGTEESEAEAAAPSYEPIAWDAFDVADAPASTRAGTEEDPHLLGTRFAVDDKWEIVVNLVDPEAEEHYLALMPDSEPAPDGKRYVLVNMTIKNLSAEPARTSTLTVYYDVPGRLHSSTRAGTGAVSPDPKLFQDGMQITGNYTGYLAYLIDDVDGSFLRLSEWMATQHVFVAIE